MPIRTGDVLQNLAKMPSETKPIVKPSLKLTHFWLYVRDTKRSIQFYRDILGFDVLQTFPDGALLKAGSIQLGVHREEDDRKSQPGGISIILHTSDIKRDYQTLLKSGVKFLNEVQKQPYGQIASFKDPDGYLFELWQP
jgi:predicted enzyme related to lactoylglutathione lyase